MLAAAVAVGACGGGDRGGKPAPRAGTGNPRMAAAFEALMQASIDGAEQARLRQAEAVIQARIDAAVDVPAVEPTRDTMIVVDLPAVANVLDVDRAPAVEIRFRRGVNDYPEALLDAQAEAAQRAVEHCAGDVDRSVSITLRIDARATPPAVHVAGAQGLDGCIERELRVLSDEGVFVAVLRVSP
jgi:hypothetical protein